MRSYTYLRNESRKKIPKLTLEYSSSSMADSMRIHVLFIDAHKHTAAAAKQQALCLMKSEIKECETVIYIKEKIEIAKKQQQQQT